MLLPFMALLNLAAPDPGGPQPPGAGLAPGPSLLFGLNLSAPNSGGPQQPGTGTYGPGLLYGLNLEPPIAPNLLAALRDRFLGAPALAELTDVFRRAAKAKQPFPYLVMNVVGETPVPVTFSPTYPAWAEIQFAVLDTDDERGTRLRDAAYDCLAPVVTPRLVFKDGKDSGGRIPGLRWEILQPGTGPKGEPAWAFFFAYRFYLTRYWPVKTTP